VLGLSLGTGNKKTAENKREKKSERSIKTESREKQAGRGNQKKYKQI